MFASQLLRILQTIPSDVKYETCVYDSAEQDMILKENQNGREVDPMAFGGKDDVKDKDECCYAKFVDDFSMDDQKMTRDSTGEKFQNGHRDHLSSLEDDADLLSSDTNAKDRMLRSPAHECSLAAEEFVHHNENEPRDSRSPYIAASDLFEKDKNFFTDKIVLECEPPELIVCYKEINYHVVKDICVDEGMPVNSKILTDCNKDDQSDLSFPQPLNDECHCKVTGAVDEELIRLTDGLAATSMENTKGIIANEHGSNQGMSKSPSESSFDRDTATDCDPEESMQKGETNFPINSKTVTHAPEESFIDKTLPIQDFGTRSFLRSFLNSLDGEENTVKQLPDQISSGKVVSKGPAVSSAEAAPNEEVQASSLCYNSKVETGSITFNFNSPAPVVGDVTNGRTENLKEQSIDSRDVLGHKDADSDNLSDARQVHRESSNDTSTGKINEQSLNIKDRSPNDFSLTSQAQRISSKNTNNENAHNPVGVSDNDSVVSLRRYDEGESSFSAAGPITYSGPMAFSGSISLRSEGSATSGRSFAFPILQPEWNSSPVRMTKADGRHFRKHKFWRSGLLCCRF